MNDTQSCEGKGSIERRWQTILTFLCFVQYTNFHEFRLQISQISAHRITWLLDRQSSITIFLRTAVTRRTQIIITIVHINIVIRSTTIVVVIVTTVTYGNCCDIFLRWFIHAVEISDCAASDAIGKVIMATCAEEISIWYRVVTSIWWVNGCRFTTWCLERHGRICAWY